MTGPSRGVGCSPRALLAGRGEDMGSEGRDALGTVMRGAHVGALNQNGEGAS